MMIFLSNRILLIGLILILTGCKIFKTPDNSISKENMNQSQVSTPRILMLNLEISSNDSILLVNSIVSSGKLKRQEYSDSIQKPGDLVLSFLDDSKNLCSKLIIPNPLLKKAEFSDDYKTIQAKTVKLDKASFSVRVQYNKCMKSVLVEKALENQSKTLARLAEIQLIVNQNE